MTVEAKKSKKSPVSLATQDDKEPKFETSEPLKKYLESSDAEKLQIQQLLLKNAGQAKELLNLKVNYEEKNIEALTLRAQLEIHKLRENLQKIKQEMQAIEQQETSLKERNKVFLTRLSEKYGLGGKPFGYNPDTLEIVSD